MATFINKPLEYAPVDVNLVNSMERYPFIFSEERKWKLRRHIAFWFCWWLFSSVLYSFASFAYKVTYFQRFPVSCIESLLYMSAHMFLSYSLMYWLIPRIVLKGKYLVAIFALAGLFLVTAAISTVIGSQILPGIRAELLNVPTVPDLHANEIFFFNGLLAGLRGGITVGGLAAAIKLMKYWYMKEQRNLQLQKQNAETQLQLLKAQVHPHFLFNTLNNIYSFTQNSSPVASRLVMGLSDMLRYMLYECNQPFVPLEKELKMLRDYMTLEQVRYNNELDINLDLPEETNDLLIAPLLLLPFVENCFKHGTSQVLEQPWISLRMTIKGTKMEMKLVNGKAGNERSNGTKGIGISNARKRLELIYPGRHDLKIRNEEDVFVVDLKLELERMPGMKHSKTVELAAYA